MLDNTDLLSSYGAGLIAKAVEAFWHERGFRHVRAERYELSDFPGNFGVRSNLVNGLPPERT